MHAYREKHSSSLWGQLKMESRMPHDVVDYLSSARVLLTVVVQLDSAQHLLHAWHLFRCAVGS